MTTEPRYYGVSSGDGNNGVSHLFPDYVVKTREPWHLAKLASITEYKPEYQTWAKENVEIDGEEDYTISAVFYESYETQVERNRMQATYDALDDKDSFAAKELEREIENYGCDYAAHIIEVFPWEGELPSCPVYESLDECFGEDVKLVAAESA